MKKKTVKKKAPLKKKVAAKKKVAPKKKAATKKPPVKKKITRKAKSLLSLRASGANQWSRCQGFLNLEKNENPLNDAERAEFGTAVHKCVEHVINEEKGVWQDLTYLDIEKIIKWAAEEGKLTALDMATLDKKQDDIVNYTHFFYNMVQQDILYSVEEHGNEDIVHEYYIEHSMEYLKKEFAVRGSADFIHVIKNTKTGEIWVTVYDLKLGRGEVESESNLQLATYLHLFINSILPKDEHEYLAPVHLMGVIIQPPMYQRKASVFTYYPTFLANAYVEPAKRKFVTGGKQCTYCDYWDVCPELKKKIKKYIDPKFLDQTTSRPETWPELLDLSKVFKKLADHVKATATTFAFKGIEIPGWGMEQKNGNRAWIQKARIDYVARKLKLKTKDITKPSDMMSVAQVETLVKKSGGEVDLIGEMSYKPQIPYLKKNADKIVNLKGGKK